MTTIGEVNRRKPAEYLVVLQLLKREGAGAHRSSMYRALDIPRADVDTAIAKLEGAGVATVVGRTVKASSALMLLDGLNLIAI
jgi:hypothetical protein